MYPSNTVEKNRNKGLPLIDVKKAGLFMDWRNTAMNPATRRQNGILKNVMLMYEEEEEMGEVSPSRSSLRSFFDLNLKPRDGRLDVLMMSPMKRGMLRKETWNQVQEMIEYARQPWGERERPAKIHEEAKAKVVQEIAAKAVMEAEEKSREMVKKAVEIKAPVMSIKEEIRLTIETLRKNEAARLAFYQQIEEIKREQNEQQKKDHILRNILAAKVKKQRDKCIEQQREQMDKVLRAKHSIDVSHQERMIYLITKRDKKANLGDFRKNEDWISKRRKWAVIVLIVSRIAAWNHSLEEMQEMAVKQWKQKSSAIIIQRWWRKMRRGKYAESKMNALLRLKQLLPPLIQSYRHKKLTLAANLLIQFHRENRGLSSFALLTRRFVLSAFVRSFLQIHQAQAQLLVLSAEHFVKTNPKAKQLITSTSHSSSPAKWQRKIEIAKQLLHRIRLQSVKSKKPFSWKLSDHDLLSIEK